jgi:bifunctional DNase/RNase
MVPVDLLGVRLELPANTPIVLLREREGRRRVLPIYIGGPEAAAIAYALEGVVPPRPLTHDLLKTVIEELGGRLDRVVVVDMREHTYYAELHLVVGGAPHAVSSRPSDSIALAVRAGAPIFVAEHVLDEHGQEPEEEEPEEEAETAEEEILEEFRDFIDSVSPEDFAGE